ncbi:MAG: hypothetical protein JWQ87_4165 [Candidatus Sulfotelmatobacter sp.]|nr:hypothetical protein [Candidatus Sulfotelmatobacter sp.]
MSRQEQRTKAAAPDLPHPPSSKPLLSLFRAFIGPAFVVGGWSLIPTSFITGVIVVYLGLVLSLAECVLEAELLRKPYQLQLCLIGVVVFVFVAFTIGVVSVSAPLRLGAFTNDLDYLASAAPTPGNIQWSPIYTELDLYVINATDNNYDDVELWVKPNEPVAAIAQSGTLADVSFENWWGYSGWITIDNVGIPWVLYATDAGYKVHCRRIPRHSSLQIVMAIAHFNKAHPKTDKTGTAFTIPPEEGLFDTVLNSSNGEPSNYWYGLAKNLTKFGSKARATNVSITGSFTAVSRQRSVNREIVPLR